MRYVSEHPSTILKAAAFCLKQLANGFLPGDTMSIATWSLSS